ncbi:hypothetical protein COLO4_11314 [Corchorus olitorius]|uniref:Uncharacterized protein n=1 Tax=Corchorus olitorius TaxID=93759 RepID=A0A1R3K4W6_9ROSI|nr:hypothetical protein COLO4_11314 [Corchorus olitorius]
MAFQAQPSLGFQVVKYQGNSKFHVAILDRSATEIKYPYTTSSNYHEELKRSSVESEDDDNIEIIEEIPPAPSRKFREKLQVPCPRPPKKMRSTNSANKTEVKLKSEGMAPQAKHNRGPAMKAGESTKTLRAREKFLAHHRAAEAFQSENPFFIRVMQPSYVGLTRSCKLAGVEKTWKFLKQMNLEIKNFWSKYGFFKADMQW